MTDDLEGVDRDTATAVGLVALTDAPLLEAAEAAGISRWALEEAIESADLAEPLGVDLAGDVTEEIDKLLDENS